MIKLYGIGASNYYNIVKHALLEKGIAFEEVAVRPNQETSYLAKNPLGKVPCLETEHGFLSETNVILEYLEECFVQNPLMPSTPWERAKNRELIKVTELYIESPAHRHVREVYFGEPRNQCAFEEARPMVMRGLHALKQLIHLSPYAAGSKLTYADIFILHSFGLASRLMLAVYDWNIIAEIPGLDGLFDRLNSTEAGRKVLHDQQQATKALISK